MLNPNAEPFVLNKTEKNVNKKPPKASPMIQSYYMSSPFPYYPPLYPFRNTTPFTLTPHRCPFYHSRLPCHKTFPSNCCKKNSRKPTTTKMIQVNCTQIKFYGVFEVKKGPRAFNRSAFGVETKPFGMHMRETVKKPGSVWKWMPKGTSINFVEQEHQLKGATTVMVKNIPNKLSKKVLLDYLDKHCSEENEKISSTDASSPSSPSEYDFVYLPMDFRSGFNLGYAFVNFTSAEAAVRFYRSYNRRQWRFYSSSKICEIKRAKIQGKEQLLRHFRHSSFLCHTDEFLPTALVPPRNGASTAGESDTTSPKAFVVGRRGCRGLFEN